MLLIIRAVLLAACGGEPPPAAQPPVQSRAEGQPAAATQPGEQTAAEPAPEDSQQAPSGPYEHLARAEAGEFKGPTVTIFSVWADEDETSFKRALQPFAERSGIHIQYEGSRDFETFITVHVEGGNAPDIAGFPQPALMSTFARDGKLVDLGSFMNVGRSARPSIDRRRQAAVPARQHRS